MYLRGKQWITDFCFEGERHIKSWGEINKSAAQAKEHKFKTEIREGTHLRKNKQIKFEAFAEKYLENAVTHKKASSVLRNKTSINALLPHFNGKLIQKIDPLSIERFKIFRLKEGRAPATVNREIETLKNMLKIAVDWDYLQKNPADKVNKFTLKNERDWILSLEDEKRLLEECSKRPQRKGGEYLQDLVKLALYTGMRQGELFNLKKQDVFLNEQYVFVSDSKNGESRRVPLCDTALEILNRRLSIEDTKSECVFHTKAGHQIKELTNAFWRAVTNAGLEQWETAKDGKKKRIRFRFHDLRHTFGSRLGMMNFHSKTIMQIMGHKTQTAAARYQHPTQEHKLNAVKGLDQVPQNPHKQHENNLEYKGISYG
ncbi:MAG: site-specific integrase [Desulfobacteraceae bacterium]|nr:MAG: site-specific integrase [Desulfobacteraceae bacterium]